MMGGSTGEVVNHDCSDDPPLIIRLHPFSILYIFRTVDFWASSESDGMIHNVRMHSRHEGHN
jgi:hypothetical protein